MQRTCECRDGLHVAIIMDGNGRWASRRGQPRGAGHQAGAAAVRRLVEAIPAEVATLTLFAFSSDNWRRPAEEVGALMVLLETYLCTQARRLVENGVRLSVIGRRDRLPDRLVRRIERLERTSEAGHGLHLRLALDYSSRAAILLAASRILAEGSPSRESFARSLCPVAGEDSRDVDLLIRTGGEKRLSDFLLWESAYAELWFTDRMWPEFGPGDLQEALDAFSRRDRRFGGLANVA